MMHLRLIRCFLLARWCSFSTHVHPFQMVRRFLTEWFALKSRRELSKSMLRINLPYEMIPVLKLEREAHAAVESKAWIVGSWSWLLIQLSLNGKSTNRARCQSENLTNKGRMPVAVVTGANSGIGHAFAQILVKEVIIFVSHRSITSSEYDLNLKSGFRNICCGPSCRW